MITGFNTDIEHRGETFHVQTEDKGQSNPIIESLIYRGGEILGSRKLPYSNIIGKGYDETLIVQLMEEQHRDMIEEIRRGKFDKPDLLRDDTLLADQSLDQVILNYLAATEEDGEIP